VNPERWQQLKELFEAALDRDAEERAAFLDKACSADPSLRREVEILLMSHSHDGFLERPAYERVPELFVSDSENALIGKRLGPYEISGKIGRGGMGVVYLAQDIRLDRSVAIKMLAPEYTSDANQRERLKREAKIAASLSHPGIATVYSFEESDDRLYIVSEYVQGRTLNQFTADGPWTFSQILDTAIQIAGALAAAHEQGIIHRDLKPENVVRTDQGVIKILDFGLARLEPRDDRTSDQRLTRSGMFLGTPAYASPEQLLGSQVDRNTDIFSFGLMLYEMAAGRHPFIKTDSMSTIARILEAEVPALNLINPEIPKEFDRIVRRCLNKKPADRYGNTRDLLAELEQLMDTRFVEPVKSSNTALWWWQFHQAVAGFGYYGMLYPMWCVKNWWLKGIEGSVYFFPTLIAVGVAANLRLHLWFTSRFYIEELQEQRRSVSRWIRWADGVFVFMLAITAIRIHTMHAIIATLLMAVAIGSLVAFTLIEPTTTRAALRKSKEAGN
jgi:eukaryotic-like serine/threonine-protein kinase